jgi:tetratricopeptide (TPR) repeat protein
VSQSFPARFSKKIRGSALPQGRRKGSGHKAFLETTSLHILPAILSKVSCFFRGLKFSSCCCSQSTNLAVEKKDNEGALREYGAAEKLVPDNAEMVYWHAVALVNMGRVDESLSLFRRVFNIDRNWVELTPRIARVGLLPNDEKVIQRIVTVT